MHSSPQANSLFGVDLKDEKCFHATAVYKRTSATMFSTEDAMYRQNIHWDSSWGSDIVPDSIAEDDFGLQDETALRSFSGTACLISAVFFRRRRGGGAVDLVHQDRGKSSDS